MLPERSHGPRARRGKLTRMAVTVGLAVVASLVVTPPATAAGGIADPIVITDWNEVAVATIVDDAGKANAEAFIWYAFEQAAVYNAVVGITRRFELYRWDRLGPRWASPEAAAAAAAHLVLSTYFPASASRLDAALVASLAGVPDGDAQDAGVAYGERAARRIIHLREGDGRFDPTVVFDEPPGPGVWRPTPPTMTPFFDPWLAELEPLTMPSPDHVRPGPPPGMRSATYTREYREVKRLGSATSTARTHAQTQTALFFSDVGVVPLQAGLRDAAQRTDLDISESARMFAAVDLSIADATIAVWDSKLHYALWRPISAIQLGGTDGNPDTVPDGAWLPLVTTPPYPDYASGLSGVMAAAGRALAGVQDLGPGGIDLRMTSAAAGETRHFTTKGQLTRQVVDARVWSGIHFRTADRVGADMGTMIARQALDRFFRPT